MKRTRRHKFLYMSVFFLIYSIIHVCSQKSLGNGDGGKGNGIKTAAKDNDKPEEKTTTTTTKPSPETTTENVAKTTKFTTPVVKTTTEISLVSGNSTVTDKNKTKCTPPAIEQVSFNLKILL